MYPEALKTSPRSFLGDSGNLACGAVPFGVLPVVAHRTISAPVGRRGFGTLGISDAVGQFPLGRPAGKQIAISEKEGGAGYGG